MKRIYPYTPHLIAKNRMSQLIAFLPFTCAKPLNPGRTSCLRLCSALYLGKYSTNNGLGPITAISPPDVKVETTFFQRNFFITEPCTYPRKIAQKKNLRFLRSPYFTPFL